MRSRSKTAARDLPRRRRRSMRSITTKRHASLTVRRISRRIWILSQGSRWRNCSAGRNRARRSCRDIAKSRSKRDFSIELAGVDYKLKDSRAAKRELRSALKIEPKDKYTLEFLGTLYFLDGNTEAALKYWNAIEKPRLRKVSVAPPPTLDPALLQNAIGFNAPQILTSRCVARRGSSAR